MVWLCGLVGAGVYSTARGFLASFPDGCCGAPPKPIPTLKWWCALCTVA